jgi:hypothetical protein
MLLFVFLSLNCSRYKVTNSGFFALKFSDKIQYFDISENKLKTLIDSLKVFYHDSSVVLYEKYEELTETTLKYKNGENNTDTAFFEITPTGKVKKYYFAYQRRSKLGYFFESLDSLEKYKIARVDSVNKTSVGVNGFPVDEIILRDNASLEKKIVDESKKIKELRFAFTDGSDDGDSAYLRFSKTSTSLFSISPKIDSTYDANLSSLVIVTNERYSNKLKQIIPRREFEITREEVPVLISSKKVNLFIKRFKEKFGKLNSQ